MCRAHAFLLSSLLNSTARHARDEPSGIWALYDMAAGCIASYGNHTIVVLYELYELTTGEKFRNFMELYELYILLDNLSAL